MYTSAGASSLQAQLNLYGRTQPCSTRCDPHGDSDCLCGQKMLTFPNWIIPPNSLIYLLSSGFSVLQQRFQCNLTPDHFRKEIHFPAKPRSTSPKCFDLTGFLFSYYFRTKLISIILKVSRFCLSHIEQMYSTSQLSFKSQGPERKSEAFQTIVKQGDWWPLCTDEDEMLKRCWGSRSAEAKDLNRENTETTAHVVQSNWMNDLTSRNNVVNITLTTAVNM